jgi:hypothetical protein
MTQVRLAAIAAVAIVGNFGNRKKHAKVEEFTK